MWDVLKTTGADPISPRPPPVITKKKQKKDTMELEAFHDLWHQYIQKEKIRVFFFLLSVFRKSVVTVSYAINIHMYKAYHGIR